MRRRAWAAALPASLAVVMALASCASTGNIPAEAGAADSAPEQAEETGAPVVFDNSRTIPGIGHPKDMDIASYEIMGDGPDGAHFDWMPVTGPSFAIADIKRGQWTIYAHGLNEKGEVVTSGHIDTFLTEDTPLDNIELANNAGTGYVDCTVTWSPEQVHSPDLEIFVKPLGGKFRPVDKSLYEIYPDGSARWRDVGGMAPGSYVARFVLKDGRRVVCGAAGALRVIDGRKSVGNVPLVVGNLATLYNIDIGGIPEDTLGGSIADVGGSPSYIPDDEGESASLSYEWYVDGMYVPSAKGPSIDMGSLRLKDGPHKVSVVVYSSNDGSINSFSMNHTVGDDSVKAVGQNLEENPDLSLTDDGFSKPSEGEGPAPTVDPETFDDVVEAAPAEGTAAGEDSGLPDIAPEGGGEAAE